MTSLIRRSALVFCILAVATQSSAEIVLLGQSRSASVYAGAWSWFADFSSDSITAPDFGQFEEEISLEASSGMAWGLGSATQNSEIQTGHFSIHGSAAAVAYAPGPPEPGYAEGHGTSDFEVRFEVSTPTPFSLAGTLARSGVGYSGLQLERNGEPYLSLSAPDGGSVMTVGEGGILEAGDYTLTVDTTFYAYADYDYPGDIGSGSFDIDFFMETSVAVDEMSWGQVKAMYR